MSSHSAQLRAEHDQVHARLSARASPHHFAHAAVAAVGALIFGGTAAKLWLTEGPDAPLAWGAMGVAAVGALGLAVARGVLGARAAARERVDVARLQALRHELRLDAPASLTEGS